MTISTQTRTAGPFIGNGVTNIFPFTFKVFQASDLLVVLRNETTGVETELSMASGLYTVQLNTNQESSPGGQIILPFSLDTQSSLTITSALGYLQPTALTNQGGFYPTVINNALDRLTIFVQQLAVGVRRSLKIPLSDGNIDTTIPSKDQRRGRMLAFHETTGAPVAGPSIATVGTVASAVGAIETVAPHIGDVQTVADNIADVTNFADVYYGPSATDPTTRKDGTALVQGDLYFNTDTKRLRTYTGVRWQESITGSVSVQQFTGDGSTVSFQLSSAPDSENVVQVFVGGVYQSKTVYGITGANSDMLTFTSAPPNGVSIEAVTFSVLPLGVVDASQVQMGNGRTLDQLAAPDSTVPVGGVEAGVLGSQFFYAKNYGVKADGITNDRAAIQSAINAARAAGGGVVLLPAGRILIAATGSPDTWSNGVVIPYNSANGTANRVTLLGMGRSTVLLAGDNNMTVIRHADSHSKLSSFSINGNGKTGCAGLSVIPEDTTQTTDNVYQIFNIFEDLYITELDEGIYATFGPVVSGSDSGCYYNRYDDITINFCKRGFYAPARPAGFGGGVGRNLFANMRIGQNCNTGLQMEAGGTNTFVSCNFEGIISTNGPNAVPTAVIVKGFGNDSNTFVGCNIEACTRHLEIDNPLTYWTGGSYDPAHCLFTQPLRTVVGDSIGTMGNLGVGVSQPLAPVHFVTPSGADVRLTNAIGGNAYWQMTGGPNNGVTWDSANTGGSFTWRINGVEYARISQSRYLKVSSTGSYLDGSAGYHELNSDGAVASLIVRSLAATQSGAGGNIISSFDTAQSGANFFRGENGGIATVLINSNGDITNTNNSYGAISDAKLKRDIVPASSQWDDIKELEFKKFVMIDDPTEALQLGLIAQDVEKVSPGLVGESPDMDKVVVQATDLNGELLLDENGQPILETIYVPNGQVTKHIKYSVLYMKAVVALQEAINRIEALESEVARMKK